MKTGRVREAGRNDPCPCGSGRKYKRCHGPQEGRMSFGQRVALAVLAILVIGGLVMALTTRSEPTGPATGVWSPEHGHYH